MPFKVGTFGPHRVLPVPLPLCKTLCKILCWNCCQLSHHIPESHGQSKISSLSMVILVLGKARSYRAPNLGCRGAESSGLFDVLLKNSARNMMHEYACCCDEGANHQFPVAQSYGLLNQPNSFCRRMFKFNAKFDVDLFLYSLSHFACDNHSVHMLTQWHLLPPTD